MITLAQILEGPMQARSHADARNGVPMSESEVRHAIATMERETVSKAARRRLAEHAARGLGNITPEGRALYRAYAECLK